jgi:prolyl-tRNA synthetase
MRLSKLFVPTTKEAPKDAQLPSHKYLIQGGFVNQVGSGLYNFLPLGQRVYDKIEKVVIECMDQSGAQKISMSNAAPAELWQKSGRYDIFGKELLRFKDRKNNDFVLGPTHEEVVTDIVANRAKSYKNLPLNLYQVGRKFRDEARPRFGLLRCREFVMKDAYSFHESEEDLKREFDLMEQTYSKIFSSLGLDFRIVDADSGAIGCSGSKEFMVLAQNGEDDIVVCSQCDYAANIEAATRVAQKSDTPHPEAEFFKFQTLGKSTIEDITNFFRVDPFYTIKAVIKKAIYENEQKIVVFFIRGNDNLQEVKAQNACGALEICDASEEEIAQSGLQAGFVGPIGLEGVDFYIDHELNGAKHMICGANEKEYHFVGASISESTLKASRFKDLSEVKEGDCCPKCASKMYITKGIEVGHIFQLGQKYSQAMNATFLDRNGKAVPYYMGCYGIGVSRLVAVAIEANHDDKGCIWNRQTAPYALHIIISNIKNEAEVAFANELYERLQKEGIEVAIDDRNERFGFKMGDFELLGIPYGVIVGKGLQNGTVELIKRDTLEKVTIDADAIVERIKEALQ